MEEQLLDLGTFQKWIPIAQDWVVKNVFVATTLLQVILLVAVIGAAYVLSKRLYEPLDRWLRAKMPMFMRSLINITTLETLVFPFFSVIFLSFAITIMLASNVPVELLQVVAKLLNAWLIIRFVTSFVQSNTWSKCIAVLAWGVTALSIVGLLDNTLTILDEFSFVLGAVKISALTVIKGIISLLVLLWLAGIISRLIDQQVRRVSDITPSMRVLLTKISKIVLITIAVLMAIKSLGIDLTALAVFSGAIGLGLGFGLQKVFSNLVSGLILLLDKSVKPGDIVEVGNTYGWVKVLGARYVSVQTLSGVEHLIPNEFMITNSVVNWSYSDTLVSSKVAVGIAYNSDIRKAMELMAEAARSTPRVLQDPPPGASLVAFADNSINLELSFWVDDPIHGLGGLKSQIMLKIWDAFTANGIDFPYPQRDVHVYPSDELRQLLAK